MFLAASLTYFILYFLKISYNNIHFGLTYNINRYIFDPVSYIFYVSDISHTLDFNRVISQVEK